MGNRGRIKVGGPPYYQVISMSIIRDERGQTP